jgi:transcriptional regulator of NAD metabolism
METINRTGRVKNERVLQRVKEERNIRHTLKRLKANWTGHILSMNCILKHVTVGNIRGKIEVARRRRRCRQLLMTLRKREDTGNRRRKH